MILIEIFLKKSLIKKSFKSLMSLNRKSDNTSRVFLFFLDVNDIVFYVIIRSVYVRFREKVSFEDVNISVLSRRRGMMLTSFLESRFES